MGVVKVLSREMIKMNHWLLCYQQLQVDKGGNRESGWGVVSVTELTGGGGSGQRGYGGTGENGWILDAFER